MNILESAFKEKMSKGAINIYWSRMKDYSDKEFKEAIIRCVDGLKYFPRVANLKDILDGTNEDEAELAYLEFRKKLENEGSYISVSFPKYPAISATIEALGGWIRISDTLEKDENWLRKDFIRLYNIMRKRGDYPKKLLGRFELENSNKGYNEKMMLENYGRKLDSKKVDRKLLKGDKEK